MQINIHQILEVKIEKLSNLGFGIAKPDGFIIFVPNTCPNDIVQVKIIKINKSYATAELLKIIVPSPHRITPFCKMQKVCGACQLQFIDYQKQLDLKKEIVSDIMHSVYGYDIDVKETVASPKIKEYRCKIQYPVSQTKESKRILAGYYKPHSHELVNIKYCPIQPECCDKIIDFIRNKCLELSITGYNEKTHTGILRHVSIRTSAYNNMNLVTLVVNKNQLSPNIKKLAEKIYCEQENISGVAVNFNTQKTNLILGKETISVVGEKYVEEKLCDKIFKIGPQTFFQVNPYCANNIFTYIKNYIQDKFESPTILDAYAGISAFGICLSDIAKKITSVEENEASVNMAKEIIKQNNICNLEPICNDAEKTFEKLLNEKQTFDITLIDPPRKGCTKECLDYALKLTLKNIIYVSCNPATLARDLKYLKENGACIKFVQPFDMFPHTYHIENVAIISI